MLKKHSKMYLRVSNDCFTRDYTFSLSGSTTAITYVLKGYEDVLVKEKEDNLIKEQKEREQKRIKDSLRNADKLEKEKLKHVLYEMDSIVRVVSEFYSNLDGQSRTDEEIFSMPAYKNGFIFLYDNPEDKTHNKMIWVDKFDIITFCNHFKENKFRIKINDTIGYSPLNESPIYDLYKIKSIIKEYWTTKQSVIDYGDIKSIGIGHLSRDVTNLKTKASYLSDRIEIKANKGDKVDILKKYRNELQLFYLVRINGKIGYLGEAFLENININ